MRRVSKIIIIRVIRISAAIIMVTRVSKVRRRDSRVSRLRFIRVGQVIITTYSESPSAKSSQRRIRRPAVQYCYLIRAY